MSGAFKITEHFQHASQVISKFTSDENKFSLFVTKLLQRLTVRDSNQTLFSSDEIEQIQSTFLISKEELDLSINYLSYIFEQSAFTSTGAEKLYDILLDTGVNQTHAKIIGRIWSSDGPDYIQKLKTQTLGYPSLESSDYRLHMITATNDTMRINEPVAFFELKIASNESVKTKESNHKTESIQMEFNHSELFSFFDQIEKIQKQLDSLN